MRRLDRLPVGAVSFSGGVVVSCKCGEVLRFMLHHDAKTSPIVEISATGSPKALVPNAFPLPVGPIATGGSCDKTTSACVDCYAANLEARYTNFAKGCSRNLENLLHLRKCGGSRAVVDALVGLVRHSEQAQRGRGVASAVFRWHSAGDIFAPWYGKVIREVVAQTASVGHWIYTRDDIKVKALLPAPNNLRVMLSADSDNVVRMARAGARLGLPLAMLADDPAHASALWARALSVAPIPLAVVCPVSGKYSRDAQGVASYVVGLNGRRSSAVRGGLGVGACVACGLCLPDAPNKSVTFLLHGGKNRGETDGRLGSAVRLRVRRQGVGS